MKLLELFCVFFKIGLFTFGGGYGMIPLVQQEVVSHGWLELEALVEYIGICESTPGPIAVNMATFVGSSQAGLPGSVCATLGVVLPSFIIILGIAAVLKGFRENRYVRAALSGIKPVVGGMILSTGAWLTGRALLSDTLKGGGLDARPLIIAALLIGGMALWQGRLKRAFSPILLILFSAVCGLAVYGMG